MQQNDIPSSITLRGKLSGTYAIYQKHNCPHKYREDYDRAEIGDWVLSGDGIIAQVLDVKRIGARAILTAFGIDNVATRGGNRVSLKLLRPRGYFYSFQDEKRKYSRRNKHLSTNDKLILLNLVTKGDVYQAYELGSGVKINTPQQKYSAMYKVKTLLKHPKALEYMQDMINDLLKKKGINVDWWMDKAVDSLKGKVETPTQFNLFTLIGKMIPEVAEALSAPSDPEGIRGNPGSGRIEPTDAKFTDICKICNSADGKLRSKDDKGNEVVVPCPVCSKQLPARTGSKANDVVPNV